MREEAPKPPGALHDPGTVRERSGTRGAAIPTTDLLELGSSPASPVTKEERHLTIQDFRIENYCVLGTSWRKLFQPEALLCTRK